MAPVAVVKRPSCPLSTSALTRAWTPLKYAVVDSGQGETDWARSAVFAGSAVEGADDVHPVERMQVVEVDDVVLDVLRARDEVADQLALSGISMPSASSTADRACAWTVVQTPQMRCVKIQASRGSRPGG